MSTEARDGWYAFAKANQTNVTALLEAVGLVLAEHADEAGRNLPTWLSGVVTNAQLTASARSSRRA